MSSSAKSDLTQIANFLKELHDGCAGSSTLWTIQQRASLHHPAPAPALAAVVAQGAEAGMDMYLGVCTRKSDLTTHQQGSREQLVHAPGLFVDIDFGTVGHAAQAPLPPDEAAALLLLRAVPLVPTLVVNTGGGLHAYWLYKAPRSVYTLEEARGYEATLTALQSLVIAQARGLGWHVDELKSSTRVLRIPGTFNFKTGTARPVTLVSTGPRYDEPTLLGAIGYTPAPLAGRPVPAKEVHGETGEVVGVEPAGAPLPLRTLRERLLALKDAKTGNLWRTALAHQSPASAQRDDALQSLCTAAAALAPYNDPDDVVDLLTPALTIWANEPTATKTLAEEQAKVRDKTQRAQVWVREQRANEGGIRDRLYAIAKSHEVDPSTVKRLTAAVQCTPQSLDRRWIIQKGQGFYLLREDGNYTRPYLRAELDPGLFQNLAYSSIEWFTPTAEGSMRKKRVEEVLSQHTTIADELIADMSLQNSYYDEKTRTFYEATCPIRPLEPTYDAGVDAWLRAFGGRHADKLLDWVATVTKLEHYTCAVCLLGPPGSGKTLFANGLANLWPARKPTELARVLDNWNEDIAKCPLLFADEGIPTNYKGKKTSIELRQLTGSSTRTLTRKFQSNANLEGAIRLVIAANNERVLTFDEDMSRQDYQALTERFLYIDTTGGATWLDQGNNRALAPGWMDGDKIAKHALWLRENRTVTPDGRWLVKGEAGSVHQNMATRNKVEGLITEWLAKYLDQPSPGIPSTAAVRVGNGEFLINTAVVGGYWDQYITTNDRYETARIGRALKNLSKGEKRVGGLRCHIIDVSLVYRWAEENQVGDAEAMKARVDAVTTDLVVPQAESSVNQDAALKAALTKGSN